MNLDEKKSGIENLLQQKINQLQQIENSRQQLTSEIVSLKGQYGLLEELIIESREGSEKETNGDSKPTTKPKS